MRSAAPTRRTRRWSASVAERAKLLSKVGELYTERRQQLAEIIVREMGKPIEQALGEVDFCVAIYDFYVKNGESLMADEPIELLDGDGSAFVRRSSQGVILGIMPWNFPYYQVARFAGPNLLVGNTILLKHAPQCPESAEAMEQIFRDAGFPEDAYINIYATNEQIEWLIADPRLRGVSLTGSERAGAAVAEIAGRNLKKVVLELGGSDPFILLSTDDIDASVEAAVGARLDNSGQSCNAGKRFIVADDLYEPFLEKFTAALTAVTPGDPNEADTTVGPLSSSTASERLEDQLKRAVASGAQVAGGGGDRDGNFFPTTVLTDITPENDAYHEEFFGPVAQVYRVGSEEEAVELANDTPFGLGSYVYHDRFRPGAAGRGGDRRGNGVHQRGRRRRRGAAVRRRQALGLRPRARTVRHRRVRQQEDDPDRRLIRDRVSSMISTVAVGTDGSATADEAVKEAAEIARRFDARLVLLSAFEESDAAPPGDDVELQWASNPSARVKSMLERAEADLRSDGIECETRLGGGEPSAVLVRLADECGADLLVIGNKGMQRRVLGSVPNTVTHKAGCSVLVVKTT